MSVSSRGTDLANRGQVYPTNVRDWWRPLIGADLAQTQQTYQPARAGTDSRLAFAALVGFTIILLLSPQQIFPVLMPLRIALLTAITAILAQTWNRLSRGLPLLELNNGIVLALLLAGWAIITLPLSFWPGGSVEFLLSKYFKTLLVFFLLASVINTVARLRAISWVLVLVAVPLSVTTIRNFAGGTLISGSQRVLGYDAPLTENPNDMALMLNLILPFAIALLLSNRKIAIKLALAVVIILMVGAIIATFSRAGFLTLGMIFLVYSWRLRKRPQWLLAPVFLVLVLASLPLVPASYFERLGTITNIEADESGSAQTRWSDTLVATRLVMQNPVIGSGVGMNIFAMNAARGETWTEIHNVYLSLGVELGLPGLLLFLALFRRCFISTGRPSGAFLEPAGLKLGLPGIVAQDSAELFFLAEAVRVACIGFALAALFHPVAYHFYFYYIAGLAIAIGSICDQRAL